MVYKWLQNIQDTIYPARCVLCDARGQIHAALCAGCQADLPWQRRGCATCALTLPDTATAETCPACTRKPPPLDAARAPLRYEPPVGWLITQMKFHERIHFARLLADLMAPHLADQARPDALVPVPLHPQRQRERGFNQATEIARLLGRQLTLPMDTRCCERQWPTAHQLSLPADQRRRNVRGAFTADESVTGRHLVIVDDVVTTGHTVFELARCLRTAGARRVDLWCAARA